MNSITEPVFEPAKDSAAATKSKSLDRYLTRAGARDYAKKYDRSWSRRRTNRREKRILSGLLEFLDPQGSLLNVACGTGRFTEILSPQSRSFALYADSSAEMLGAAQETLSQVGCDRVQFAVIDVTDAPVASAHDLVVCIRCLHHLPTPERQRALDYLTGSSSEALVFTVASTSTWKGWWRAYRSKHGSRPRGEHLISREALQLELQERGFQVEKMSFVSRLFSSQMWILARRDLKNPAA